MRKNNKIIVEYGGRRVFAVATCMLTGLKSYNVCVNYVKNEAAAKAVVKEVFKNGGIEKSYKTDVSKEEDVIRLF